MDTHTLVMRNFAVGMQDKAELEQVAESFLG